MHNLNTYTDKRRIFYNIVNSLLGGGIYLAGALSTGNFTKEHIFTSIAISLSIALGKFKDFWGTQKNNYNVRLSFI